MFPLFLTTAACSSIFCDSTFISTNIVYNPAHDRRLSAVMQRQHLSFKASS